MNKIARFEKISYEQFYNDCKALGYICSDDVRSVYYDINIPCRATSGSAGYDFFLPYPLTLEPQQTVTIPTGIRAFIENGWFLMCCPRSGLGFKYRIRLDNTIGIIDSDYYYAKNGGHIMIKITNESLEGKTLSLDKNTAFAQGIFLPYGITVDDNADSIRTGGFGSTSTI